MSRKPLQSALTGRGSGDSANGEAGEDGGLQSTPRHVIAVERNRECVELLKIVTREQGWTLTVERDIPALVSRLGRHAAIDLLFMNFRDVRIAPAALPQLLIRLSAPVLMATESNHEVDDALRAGATATVQTPHRAETLMLAMLGLMRRFGGLRTILSETVQMGDLTVALANHTIERRGHKQVLSPTEWQLFAYLLANPGRVFTRYELARGAWGPAYSDRLAQTELYVSRLRRKIEPDPRDPQIIETIRGQGYRLRAQPARAAAPEASPTRAERLLEGETDLSGSPPTSAHWKRVYSQLVGAKRHLIVAARDDLDRLMPEVKTEIEHNDIRTLESDLAQLEERLETWSRRLDESTSSVGALGVETGHAS